MIMMKTYLLQAKDLLIRYKKKIGGAVVVVAVLGITSAGVHAMYQVKGIVTGVNDHSVTVANFFRTQTVDLAGVPVNMSNIKPGDKIKIQKSLNGNVLFVRLDGPSRHEHHDHHHDRDYRQ
jgi:hypothetical protein